MQNNESPSLLQPQGFPLFLLFHSSQSQNPFFPCSHAACKCFFLFSFLIFCFAYSLLLIAFHPLPRLACGAFLFLFPLFCSLVFTTIKHSLNPAITGLFLIYSFRFLVSLSLPRNHTTANIQSKTHSTKNLPLQPQGLQRPTPRKPLLSLNVFFNSLQPQDLQRPSFRFVFLVFAANFR